MASLQRAAHAGDRRNRPEAVTRVLHRSLSLDFGVGIGACTQVRVAGLGQFGCQGSYGRGKDRTLVDSSLGIKLGGKVSTTDQVDTAARRLQTVLQFTQ